MKHEDVWNGCLFITILAAFFAAIYLAGRLHNAEQQRRRNLPLPVRVLPYEPNTDWYKQLSMRPIPGR